MDQKTKATLDKTGKDIVKWLEDIFKQVPHLPENIREVLVKIAPILSLIFGVLGVVGGLSALALALGLSSFITMSEGVNTGIMLIIISALGLLSSALTLIAYPKLKTRQYSGWMLLFWAELVSTVSAVFTITTGGMLGPVLGIVVGFYLLFEIKSHYK